MKKTLLTMLLLCLALTGCIVDPGYGWGDRGHAEHHDHDEHHDDRH
ncbi:MAG: hypothetical protein P4L71_06765 [Acetobacteraceae bacterium]|nr:hypothetical protein [Acetobacteraceae bacterium]